MKTVRTPTLEIAYEESGPAAGPPVVLLHGFPDDVRAYDGVARPLAAAGWRVLVPYLRGYGPTRFLDARTPRSGQQAALGRDLLDFLDTLGLERAALAGYDWGGRAACIVAALWPDRVTCLVSIGGYNIQNIARSGEPGMPDCEHRLWSWRAWPRRAGGKPETAVPAAVGIMVAELAVRRSDLRADRGILRQSRFRRGGDPVLPSPLRPCTGRFEPGCDRASACRTTADHGADDRAARRL